MLLSLTLILATNNFYLLYMKCDTDIHDPQPPKTLLAQKSIMEA
jgi:hypothetical protein